MSHEHTNTPTPLDEIELSAEYDADRVCQFCRRRFDSRIDRAVHATREHARGEVALSITACPRCPARLFVCAIDEHDCPNAAARLVIADDRDESDSCQRSTPGCCVDHARCDHDCETW